MKWFKDIHNRKIRLTDERQQHMETNHPEMAGQIEKIQDTLMNPDIVVRSRTDLDVQLFYKLYSRTPVTEKYLCVVVKIMIDDMFIITAYFTNTTKRGETVWERK